jgi:hypothetical protein
MAMTKTVLEKRLLLTRPVKNRLAMKYSYCKELSNLVVFNLVSNLCH